MRVKRSSLFVTRASSADTPKAVSSIQVNKDCSATNREKARKGHASGPRKKCYRILRCSSRHHVFVHGLKHKIENKRDIVGWVREVCTRGTNIQTMVMAMNVWYTTSIAQSVL